jgi:hypothetical protein
MTNEEIQRMDKRPARQQRVQARAKPRTTITISEVVILLRKLEQHNGEIQRHREGIAGQTAILHDWLTHSDDFAEAWTNSLLRAAQPAKISTPS